MIFSTLLISTLLILGRAEEESKEEEEESVVTLTTENFAQFIADNSKVLVEFYAPWCGHCKALAPEFEKAAQAIAADDDIDAMLAKVDATEEKDLATKYGVKGFPTLKFFTGDAEKPADYSGGRTEPTIVQWLKTRSMPPVSILTSVEQVDAFKKKGRVVLVGFFAEDDEEAKTLNEVAEANRESVVVGQVSDASVSITDIEFGKLYMFREFGEPVVAYEGDITSEGITAFLNAERFPLIDAIGPENYKDYVDRGLPLVWISLNVDDEEEKQTIMDALTPFAKASKGKLSFTWVDAQKYAQHVQNLGITDTPGLLIAGDNNKKFLFDGKVSSEDDLKAFFEGYAGGTLEAHMKSEPVPESNDEAVYVLVGSEFESVIGGEKDVFVEFYAPWCGHCKKLAPEYEKVGEAFSDVDSVIIAKVDATENDTPEDIKGFPTLIFYAKGQSKGVNYGGDRNSEGTIEYIKENASGDVSGVKTEL
jgi:protein disulfide-isomerase A1